MNPLADREPVSTYEQAVWWLVGEWINNPAFLDDGEPLPAEGRFACEMFWVSQAQLRKDVRKAWGEVFNEAKTFPRRVV